MFFAVVCQDTLRIKPDVYQIALGLDQSSSGSGSSGTTSTKKNSKPVDKFSLRNLIIKEIENKYQYTVIKDKGLVMFVWDIISIGSFITAQNDPSICVEVQFRLCIYRPIHQERLQVKVLDFGIIGNSITHLIVGTDFFPFIKIPAHALFKPHRYDPLLKKLLWEQEESADSTEEDVLNFIIGIDDEVFIEIDQVIFASDDDPVEIPRMQCTAKMDVGPLGPPSWWN